MGREVDKCVRPKEPRASALDVRRDFVAFERNAFAACQGSARAAERHTDECRCRRTLMRWLETGGPVPPRLAARLSTCESCWRWATRIVRVQNALALLATEAVPQGLLGRANDKALRMLVRQLREGVTAEKLRSAKPDASLWTKLEGPLTRQASAVAAAMLIFALRAGVNEGLDKVQDWAEPLAQAHYERHIDDQGLLL